MSDSLQALRADALSSIPFNCYLLLFFPFNPMGCTKCLTYVLLIFSMVSASQKNGKENHAFLDCANLPQQNIIYLLLKPFPKSKST
jgi:hypothetical protein